MREDGEEEYIGGTQGAKSKVMSDKEKYFSGGKGGEVEEEKLCQVWNQSPKGIKWSAVPLSCLTIVFQFVGF